LIVSLRQPKKACRPICPVTGSYLNGVSAHFSTSKANHSHKKVKRSYGALLSGNALRERVLRAFLIEEQKIAKRVLRLLNAKE
jgi:large subunit ribosomal protein L34e